MLRDAILIVAAAALGGAIGTLVGLGIGGIRMVLG